MFVDKLQWITPSFSSLFHFALYCFTGNIKSIVVDLVVWSLTEKDKLLKANC